jgi:Na+/phosphate symporter
MGQAVATVRNDRALIELFARIDVAASTGALFVALTTGVLFTAIVQSSGATLAIAVTAASTGLFSFHLACALVLGATLGTTITALASSIRSDRAGKRTAIAHTTLNVVGVLGGAILFYPLAGLAGRAVPSVGVGVAVALYLTLHKIILTGIFFRWRRPFAAWTARLVPERFPGVRERFTVRPIPADAGEETVRAEFLREIDLFSRYLRDMFAFSIIVTMKKRESDLSSKIEQYEQIVDAGHKKLVRLIHEQGRRQLAKYGIRLREREATPRSLERLLVHSAHRRVFTLFHRVCICKCFDAGDLARCDAAERELRRHKRELLLTVTDEKSPLDLDAILELADILSEYSKINHSVKRILQVNLDIAEGRGVYLYKK